MRNKTKDHTWSMFKSNWYLYKKVKKILDKEVLKFLLFYVVI